ncbi:MAG: type II toxin-antitoxin system RelE/ParE family toxin [Gammaproteobacteria bacterium]|uniref:type II toxin-antitoxin system RelE/ParE family toxin n=1 Tax=Rhodoferax sp. TaxID=50421 RepID=UPI0017986306|nr:type II toxin-antitoxin system RelE/ParE family toxin [Rhodoferax sp.]MBU3897662.1 type II toxin-antitoxin system RelE/ParE family toxin [Gammaproteobacteria bacterium]MBA3056301.1 type II toxin-antitoxin system RelE/ParE family toxin [Rhodoferax sp.]MBU3998571.1 type II toxin-antitoxin system RelE/ParE family toxin [Gammaproteobacteria bacterium]MBU4080038.1 type II toxin-antitoxin system RelE/ParE family toxin [Gammaproteobacteria bacterium]MBU4112091.1 type II toxin-antitoxin system RelE
MMASFEVYYTDGARSDLLRLYDFLLERAQTVEDFDAAQLAIDAIKIEIESHLSRSPFIFRKAGKSPFLRELIIPFRSSGYVALYEIEDNETINVLAVRHQLEDDYH